jgi:hypothetical protein
VHAAPALADDAPTAPPPPAVTLPAPPDASADAAAAQLGAANVNVSLRIDSPGDNGSVDQAIAAVAQAASTVATAAPADTTADAAETQAAATTSAAAQQTAPSNVAVSIRINSPGDDGTVSQAISAAAAASTSAPQYQQESDRYQPVEPAAPLPAAPQSPVHPAAPAPAAAVAPALPATWNWTWNWSCGDIADAGIAHLIDTATQSWNWTWNLGGMCSYPSAPTSEIPPLIPPEMPPSPPAPAPAAAPVEPAPASSSLPAPAPAPVDALEADVGAARLPTVAAPLFAPGVALTVPWLELRTRAAAAGRAYSVRASAAPAPSAAEPTRGRDGEPERHPLAPGPDTAPPAGPSGGSGGGGGGGSGGGGIAAALALSLVFGLPGIAVLRWPAAWRRPRWRVDEIRNRPG